MRSAQLGPHRLADDAPAVVLAEIGSNHMGSVDEAHALIDMAAACGAHGVKFQRRHNQTLYSRALLEMPYDNPVSFGPTYGAHREALELPLAAYPGLIAHARTAGMAFVCTAFDEASVSDLVTVGVDAIKIASGGATDAALIAMAVASRLPLLISTGGCTEADIVRLHQWAPKALILHCTAAYPCAFAELGLGYLTRLRALFPDTVIGWSGHDNGIAMALVAYTLGARLIEKHITRNRANKGTDHAFSLERPGLDKLCRDLARAHVALGDGQKHYHASERQPIAKMRRRPTPQGWQITGEVDA